MTPTTITVELQDLLAARALVRRGKTEMQFCIMSHACHRQKIGSHPNNMGRNIYGDWFSYDWISCELFTKIIVLFDAGNDEELKALLPVTINVQNPRLARS